MMAQTLSVIPLLGIILEITCFAAAELRFISDPPTLNIYGIHRMNKSDNLELTCRGRQNLRWTTPAISTRYSISDCSGSGLFCKRLTIINSTVNETGQYQCFYIGLKAEDGKTSAAVYVFVQDYKVPFVPSEKEYEVVFIREGERVVIPCRGSVENLNVTLNIKYPVKEFHPDGKDSVWDARTGFTVPTHLISYAGVVSCQTHIGNETFKSPLYIVAVVGYKIYDLTLTPNNVRLSVGEQLILRCTAFTELNVGIEFNWTHSGGALVSTPHSSVLIIPWTKVWEVNVGEPSTYIPVKYSAYPEPIIKWCVHSNICFMHRSFHALKLQFQNWMDFSDALVIREVKETDAGIYTVILTNKITKEEQRRSFQLLVNVPPCIIEKEMAVDIDVYLYGSSTTLSCTARGFPVPTHIQWEWMSKEDCPEAFMQVNSSECTNWRDVSNRTGHNHVQPIRTDTDQKITSSLKIQKAEAHALYRCTAANKVGKDSRVIFFHVTRGLEVTMSPSNRPLEEDHVILRCKADSLIYGNLTWFRVTNVSKSEQGTLAQPCRSLTLQPTPLSHAVLTPQPGTNVTLELSLRNASHQDEGLYACQVVNIITGEKTYLEAPRILNNFTDQKVRVSSTVTLRCMAAGTPNPIVAWTKNNHTVVESSGVTLNQQNRSLTIQRVTKEDSGLYTCTVCNSLGCDTAQASLSTEGAEEKTNVELIVPIGSVVIAMFFWLLIVFVIRGRKRPNGVDLKTGYLSMILDSEDMPMDEQCERLTYDASKWEFPRDRLKLGDPLGRGAFGQVVEAAAFGIEKATTCTTVAVKMLKEGATASEYRALMSELKILIHIGHYLNVVNLLGACTKPGGPLMVIVEYCKHGNLSSYLKSKRGEYSPYKVNYGIWVWGRLPSWTSAQEQRSDDDHLTMEDLISYSFQVAKGMEFLSSRKCIHRDLAARNILLSENNVVKICDFGLARDVYKDPDYVRKGDARLPLKWMAPETIFDRVYTTQSDVWSFGVLLWEIFSLGASPYPGVCIDESFCRRLKEGTRMRPPEYATTEIYQTMLDCWLNRPTDRPTFTELVEHLGNLLQASAQQVSSGLNKKAAVCGFIDTSSLYRLSQQNERCSRPLSVKTFEDVPVAQLLRCKSKESLGSESSNQTSGYQSGYHSDDADTPIYANEEIIMKHKMLKKPPLPKTPDKFNMEIRYSTPPV
uniref:receptor protein-tyrosine kinase n=1 Tax=Astatotilapia calliptera TaxID=8154 RepID=A0AAX7VUF1_ASTCA